MQRCRSLSWVVLVASLLTVPAPGLAQLALTPEASLTIPPAPTFGLGGAVAISSDGVRLVAARDDSGMPGNVRVFVRSGTTWTEEATLEPGDVVASELYGHAVGMAGDGTRVIVGSPEDTVGSVVGRGGSARVFVRTGTTWTLEATLVPSVPQNLALFGSSVALSEDGLRAIVGSHLDDTVAGGFNAGSAHVFVRTGSTWAEEGTLLPPMAAAADAFGFSVALDAGGDRAIVGAQEATRVPALGVEGYAYVFARGGSGWAIEATLSAEMPGHDDHFGHAVALSNDGTRALVSAHVDDVPGVGDDAGSAAVFLRTGTSWALEATLIGAMPNPFDHVGMSADLSGAGDVVVLGGELDGGSSMGRLHVFQRTGVTWGAPSTSATGIMPSDLLGASVAISSDGTRVVSGALGAGGVGAARVYTVGPATVPMDGGVAMDGGVDLDAGVGEDAGIADMDAAGTDAGTPGSDSGGARTDTGSTGTDSGTAMLDAGTASGGGGCSVGRPSGAGWLVLLVLAALRWRR